MAKRNIPSRTKESMRMFQKLENTNKEAVVIQKNCTENMELRNTLAGRKIH